ncbi:MAG: HDOD domain-containing protein [Thermodesulfobacteriota bacterium]|nr:HDOD domain-containing protein [Thermodesulfobacteriota bacterium]
MQNYTEIVGEIGDLPPMPIVAVKVLELLQCPDTSINQLAQTISLDAAVSARLLKIANSSLYSGLRDITTLHNALVLLGERTVRSLVLASSMSSVNKSYGLLEKMLWEESVGCALAARYLSTKLNVSNSDEAFLVGLFSNLGKIIRNNNEPERYRELVEAVYNGAGDYLTLEQEVFSSPYSKVGAAVLYSWEIAPLLVESVRCQMDVHSAEDKEVSDLAALVNVASNLCMKLGIGHRCAEEDFDLSKTVGAEHLLITVETIAAIPDEFEELFAENSASFMA